jgi:hypothetical protein
LPARDLRDTLFGDVPLDAWPPVSDDDREFPWSAFSGARSYLNAGRIGDAMANWRSVLEQPGLETRHYLQAWHFLRQVGEEPPAAAAKQVLGVVAEVALPEGLDVLAAYVDHTARYYNSSGSGVVWDHPDGSLDRRIDSLISASAAVVGQIGPWEGTRPTKLPRGEMRLSFLTPGGLHFGQGPIEAISSDPMGGSVVEAATLLMSDLIQRANAA